ncbi:hypothetical protein GOP47_0012924, partial [Adiantum capillus-veneris]
MCVATTRRLFGPSLFVWAAPPWPATTMVAPSSSAAMPLPETTLASDPTERALSLSLSLSLLYALSSSCSITNFFFVTLSLSLSLSLSLNLFCVLVLPVAFGNLSLFPLLSLSRAKGFVFVLDFNLHVANCDKCKGLPLPPYYTSRFTFPHVFQQNSLSLSLSLSLSFSRTRARTHTHTHKHVLIIKTSQIDLCS